MSSEALKQNIERVPFGMLLALALGYLAYDYYSFSTDSQSPLLMKQAQYESIRSGNVALQAKLKQAYDFYKGLDQKRIELRTLSTELNEMKTTLSDQLDIPAFMKIVLTESSKVGITVLGLKPGEYKESEFYAEQTFDLSFRSAYVQMLLFLERLSNVERIVRVDNFNVKREGSSLAPYVEVSGTVQIKTYRYTGSKADELAKKAVATAPDAKTAPPASSASNPPQSLQAPQNAAPTPKTGGHP